MQKGQLEIRKMMGYISSLTNLPIPRRLPKVLIVPYLQMVAVLLHDWPDAEIDKFEIQALYWGHAKTIMLPLTWAEGDPKDQSLFVHELVHYMQDKAATNWDQKKDEEEAYFVQGEYLKSQGIDIDSLGFNTENMNEVSDLCYGK